MATIQARKGSDGKSRYRVQVRVHGFPPETATFVNKTDATQWAQRREAAIREGRAFPDREAKRHTLADLIDRYLGQTQKKRDASHYERQRMLLSWWRARLGDFSLAQVTPARIAEYRDRFLAENIGTKKAPRNRAPATANRCLAALSAAFKMAVQEWHWLPDNPVHRVRKEQEPQGRVRYLSEEERKALLDACQKSELPELYLIVLLALTTGMRRGEILGLRWTDIDLERRFAVLTKTKNRDRRSVTIVPQVADLLRQHGKVRRLDTDLVFPGPGYGAIWFDRAWWAALEAAGIEDFRFHDLRHTAASYLAMSGATTAEIAAVLGHRTLAMVKRYAHLSDQHTDAVIERMTNKFFG